MSNVIAQKAKEGMLHGKYKTVYKGDMAYYTCGTFHNGVEFKTGSRKRMREHILKVHYMFK